MMPYRPFCLWASMLIGAMVVLAGCTYDAAVRQLSLAEQSEFYTYKQVMTTISPRRPPPSARPTSVRLVWHSASRGSIRWIVRSYRTATPESG